MLEFLCLEMHLSPKMQIQIKTFFLLAQRCLSCLVPWHIDVKLKQKTNSSSSTSKTWKVLRLLLKLMNFNLFSRRLRVFVRNF
jgi:hypothetical protein